jgi:hypothetical protein
MIRREQTAKNTTNVFGNPNKLNVLGFKHLVDIEGVTGSIPVAPTIYTLRLYRFRDARDSAAISKTCLPNSLIRAVSGLAFTANEPNSASRLCIEKFRS